MANVLVLYYSSYGHIETMAGAVAEGVLAAGESATVKRVPELVTEAAARSSHYKLDQAAPIADPSELADYGAVIVGVGTRYGRMAAQMASFWDMTGGLWAQGRLVGKVGAAFSCTGSQHGGQETTLLAIHTMMFHHGMVQVGLPYSFKGQTRMDEVTGGSPYGATTLAGGDGSRPVSENELAGARYLGNRVAEIAARLAR